MLIVHVFVHVRPDAVQPFIDATLANAHASRAEPGVAAFEVIRQDDDPTVTVVTVAPMLAEAIYQVVRNVNVSPTSF